LQAAVLMFLVLVKCFAAVLMFLVLVKFLEGVSR